MAGDDVIGVAIVDDHRLFAETLAMGLETVPDIEVVAVYADGSAVIERPPVADALILDLEMPGVSGLDVLRSGLDLPPALVVTMHSSDEQRRQAFAAGAAGFLPKSAPLRDVAAALRALAHGARLTDSATLRDFLDSYAEAPVDPRAAALTGRERELLGCLADGITSTADLADRLFISEKTVKNHLASIFEKLGVADRAQAALEAVRLGITSK